ncbi:hypothetical protein TNCV_406231 [Trichonephila clavipes]|nr:hypothetical protein TNCV_406231 [Trichonephila clavipes]
MDKASSPPSKSTTAYLAKKKLKREIKCIPFDEILVKSSDASSMDFCAFGLLKQTLGKRHPRTLNGLWKTIQEEGSKIGATVLRKSLLSSKIRARAILESHGYQIEANLATKSTAFIDKKLTIKIVSIKYERPS